MADVKICDRCRKELVDRQTIINIRPVRYILGVEQYTIGSGWYRRDEARSYDLCDKCTNELMDLLKYIPDSNTGATDV